MRYRPEIDGLRTIAVAAVIAFHLDEAGLVGGFLGVDVFFVISGYLITGLILRDVEAGTFRITAFWTRRIRRLLPALVAMVTAVLLAGHFLLIRPFRTDLPLQALSAVFSFANIHLWQSTGGYWTAPAASLPLLHTWSLSLEEQFYLCLPPLLILLHRLTPGRPARWLALGCLTSFAICLAATPTYRSASFFLLPTRMWELLLGGLLAAAHRRGNRLRGMPGLSELGLVIIASSFLLVANDASFPGWKPLIPAIGTLLILHALPTGRSPGSALLRLPPMVYAGKLSYSLYLWHWPVIVYCGILGLNGSLLPLSLAIPLAAISHHAVENPFRYGFRRARLGWLLLPLAPAACIGLILLSPTSPLLHGMGNLDSEESLTRGRDFEALDALRSGLPAPLIALGEGASLCLVGSSHARVLGQPLLDYARSRGWSAYSLATSNIGITSLPHPTRPDADEINARRLDEIRRLRPDCTIVAGMWTAEATRPDYPEVLTSFLRGVAATGSRVLILGQVPLVRVPDPPGDLRLYLVSNKLRGKDPAIVIDPAVEQVNQQVRMFVEHLGNPSVHYADPYPVLMPGGSLQLVLDGRFLYSDHHHVNDDGARILFRHLIQPELEALFPSP